MKTKNIILAALLTAMPAAMTAQENIQKAFNALLNDKIVRINKRFCRGIMWRKIPKPERWKE